MAKTDEPADTVAESTNAMIPGRDVYAWRALSTQDRLTTLVEHPKARALVRKLPTTDLFYLIKELGVDTTVELLPLLSESQWQGFIDIDAWSQDHVEMAALQQWLDAAALAGPGTQTRLLRGLEDELLVTLLAAKLTVHERDLDVDFVPDTSELLTSPDGMFYLEFTEHPDWVPTVDRLLRLLYADDPDRARRVLRASRWELLSDSEERCFQWRTARMEELGYPSMERAVQIFSPIQVREFKEQISQRLQSFPEANLIASDHPVTTGLTLPDVQDVPFLAECLSVVPDGPRRIRIAQAFVHLTQAILVATNTPLGDVDEHHEAARRAFATVSLALSYLSNNTPTMGAEILARVWMGHLFGTGHTLLATLQRRAIRLHHRTAGDQGYELFDSPTAEVISGLIRPVPLCFSGIVPTNRPRHRLFQSTTDLQNTRKWLAHGEAVVTFFEQRFGFSPAVFDGIDIERMEEDFRRHVRFSTLLATGIAQSVLGNGFQVAPLSEAGLQQFVRQAFEGTTTPRRIRKSIRKALREGWFAKADSKAAKTQIKLLNFVNTTLKGLEETLGAIPPGDYVDPRYVGSALLVESHSD